MAFWAEAAGTAPPGAQRLADIAARNGHTPVLRLLCRRFGPAVLTLNYQAWSAAYSGHLEALRYLAEAVGGEATEGDEEGQAGDRGGRGGGASAGGAGAGAAGSRVASGSEWASVLRAAGYYGADLSLARLMYARCGRDTDILFAAATAGGSVETAEWAMEAQRAANKDCRHPLLHPAELWVMAAGGNLATTTWALELGLVGPLELEGYDSDTRDSKGGSGSDGGGLLPLLGTGYKLELRIELNMHSLRVWVWRLVQQERAALQPGAAGAEEEGSAVAGSADGCEQGSTQQHEHGT
ncbi:hypothetical protein CHLRE_17g712771v5 [Chlamydomonas reinhardtii]|uniref:Uncharacterized protein n=1 Tax=Chlamydomonas reinhardtii TaxID=3055 RepID=A0A2K3CPR3_CHLRE|nr:uncharacterized protein CHLRE_17g712771v5 [Chlamydomonas reinhardtii]PNW70267.1 hypothetical protein CHLRE_17g712771v5 [Chlamydomonas reinhardtii]